MNMHEAIRFMRKTKGITMVALAEAIGVNYNHYCRIELGKVDPKLSTLMKISDFLDCKLTLTFL